MKLATIETARDAQGTPLAPGAGMTLPAAVRALPLRPGAVGDLVALLVVLLGLTAFSAALDVRVATAIATVTLALLALRGEYEDRTADTPLPDQLSTALSVAAVSTIAVAAVSVLADKDVAAGPFVGAWMATGLALGATRSLAAVARGHARRHGRLVRRTLIVGAGRIGHLTAQRLVRSPELGFEPIGFLDKEPLPAPSDCVDLPVLGASWDLERVLAERDVAQVIVAFSTAPDDVLLSIVRRCHHAGVQVAVVPRLFEVHSGSPATRLGALPLISLAPPRHDSRQLQVKYALDRVFACAALIVLSPLLLAIAAAIRLTMGGPVLYRQERVGRNGGTFPMLKFRTMSGDGRRDGEADAAWAEAVLCGDHTEEGATPFAPRVTGVGALLRRYSLDELPQLWNVLVGEMSLIGPRPERRAYVERFLPAIYRYAERHRVKPGITGWAQVNGLRGETSLTDRVEWDNYYVENWSWGLELRIWARTLSALRLEPPPDPLADAEAAEAEAEAPEERQRAHRAAVKVAATIVLLVFSLLAVTTSHAHAAAIRDPSSAVDQYVEALPTAAGPLAVDATTSPGGKSGSGVGGGGGVPLSSAAQRRLRDLGGPLARRLQANATNPRLGAPVRRLPTTRVSQRPPGAFTAAAKTVTSDPGGQLTWLLIVLAATTILAVGAAVNERFRRRGAD
jgi:exopolysaccharide biosynthesis polyprenyl glycosylphosphotransferase